MDMSRSADEIAEAVTKKKIVIREWQDLRDFVDRETYSNLDCTKLDILTDMVFSRIGDKL